LLLIGVGKDNYSFLYILQEQGLSWFLQLIYAAAGEGQMPVTCGVAGAFFFVRDFTQHYFPDVIVE